MGQNYAEELKTGSQSLTTSATKLTPPVSNKIPANVVVTLLAASTSAWSYSSEAAGTYRDAGLNSATGKYEKLFPVGDAFNEVWFKSNAGTITMEWDALLNDHNWPNHP